MMRRIGNLLAVCAAAGLCYGMQQTKPHYVDLTGPIPSWGAMGQTVETLRFDVRVDDVVFARRIRMEQYGKEKLLTTGGLWAIVSTNLEATSASNTVARAVWTGPTGLRYMPSERLGMAPLLPPHAIDPGLPRKGLFVFEIPSDQATNAALVVANARFSALDSEARIALDRIRLRDDGVPETFVMTYDMSKAEGSAR